MITILNKTDESDFKIISASQAIIRVLFASLLAGVVESFSYSDIDNITVFIAAIIADVILCQVFIFLSP